MLIGYVRVSKADRSQVLDLQPDALIASGVPEDRIYEDLASGRFDDRPGLNACLKALQPGNLNRLEIRQIRQKPQASGKYCRRS